MSHDLLTMYSAKAIEYLIAVSFMVLFIPFWRFVNREKVPALAPAVYRAPSWISQVVDWFRVPEDVYFHPGHAWARVEGRNLVTVGMDDFAHKLVGRVSGLRLPAVGSRVGQGEKGWSLVADAKAVDMLSPVDGEVVAVNERLLESPGGNGRDPYEDGWLLRIRAPRLEANVKHLMSGGLARRWMEEVCDTLRAKMNPGLGQVYQDGGVPIDGMARGLDPEGWDEMAREFFLTA